MQQRRPPEPATRPDPSAPAPATAPARIRVTTWREAGCDTHDGPASIAAALAEPGTRLWVDVASTDHQGADELARALGIHPLIVEDISERNQRAKLEETDGILHLVLFALTFAGEVHETEIDLVLSDRFLLTVHDPAWDPFALPQLREGAARMLTRGPDFLLYALADGIVDEYFPVLDALGDELDDLQDDVIAHASS